MPGAELAPAGGRAVIVERSDAPSSDRRARGLARPSPSRSHVRHQRLPTFLRQPNLETVRTDHALELGVPIWRAHQLTGWTGDCAGVTAPLTDAPPVRARYLVGCDPWPVDDPQTGWSRLHRHRTDADADADAASRPDSPVRADPAATREAAARTGPTATKSSFPVSPGATADPRTGHRGCSRGEVNRPAGVELDLEELTEPRLTLDNAGPVSGYRRGRYCWPATARARAERRARPASRAGGCGTPGPEAGAQLRCTRVSGQLPRRTARRPRRRPRTTLARNRHCSRRVRTWTHRAARPGRPDRHPEVAPTSRIAAPPAVALPGRLAPATRRASAGLSGGHRRRRNHPVRADRDRTAPALLAPIGQHRLPSPRRRYASSRSPTRFARRVYPELVGAFVRPDGVPAWSNESEFAALATVLGARYQSSPG